VARRFGIVCLHKVEAAFDAGGSDRDNYVGEQTDKAMIFGQKTSEQPNREDGIVSVRSEKVDCPICSNEMQLVSREPFLGPNARYERRRYECDPCNHSESHIGELASPSHFAATSGRAGALLSARPAPRIIPDQ
jgi:hypothetical protein